MMSMKEFHNVDLKKTICQGSSLSAEEMRRRVEKAHWAIKRAKGFTVEIGTAKILN